MANNLKVRRLLPMDIQQKKSGPSPLVTFRSSWLMIGLILSVSAVLVGIVLIIHFWKGIPIGMLTRDPTSISGSPFYVGFLSQIALLLWSASAAICLFSARVLSTQTGNLKIKSFLLVSGLLALILGLDDAFLLHEEVIPRFLGVPEKAVYVIYVGLVLFYLVIFHSVIRKTEYVLLVMAFVFFGVSVTLDFFEPLNVDPYLFEDGAKLVGIVSWLAYFFRTGASSLFNNVSQQDDA